MGFCPSVLPCLLDTFILLFFLATRSAGSTLSSPTLCPSFCSDGGVDNGEWFAYHDKNQLSMCDSPLLLDFNVHNALDNPNTHTSIRACSAHTPSSIFARDATGNGTASYSNSSACGVPVSHNTTSHFTIIQSGSPNSTNSATDLQALRIAKFRLAHQNTMSCNSTTSFVMVGSSIVGVYAGASVLAKPFSDQVLERLIEDIANHGVSDNVHIESCSTDPSFSSRNMGIVIGSFSTLPLVQSAVSAWSHGGCMVTNSTANSTATPWQCFDLPLLSQPQTATNVSTNTTKSFNFTPRGRRISRRDDCMTAQVKSGDSCASLAAECGISGDDLTKYNTDPSLCSTLSPGQHVCCSAGSLPDFSPKPQSDGTCATHSVVTDDTCGSIASANSITVDNIGTWNNNTWQFMGCNNLQIGQVICISSGDPPMPAPVQNAICGPQVPNTQKPDNITLPGALASLNPCPLKVCCDIWGQCGNTNEFCTISKSDSGAPGTAAPGQNGCISNCGTEIVSSDPPAKPFTVGYFEGFNQQRPCLNMDASDIDVDSYTHLHFGFATITESFDVAIDDNSTAEWDEFQALRGPAIILSFGGWAFSTDVASYSIFRNAVTEQNRHTFAQNIASFVSSSGIGGVDFDWEYPGAPDIPGIAAASPNDGQNYLAFLKELRSILPADKTISFAAPASYWYLKSYPIAEMSDVVDYIIYMTYDLHGQWDYGNKYSDVGCSDGNCLRSQVNSTETHTSLSMITKAGVPSNKIVVGVTSYGRSFQMIQSGCTGPMCTYTGPDSGATPGRCTQTAGYLAQAEIDEILQNDKSATTFYDNDSESDIMVYNDTQWVAYMSNNTRIARTATYLGWNFLGTVDWAIDLAAFSESEIDETEPLPDCNNARNYNSMDDILNDHSIPDSCMNMYIMNAMSQTMSESLSSYQDIMSDGYKDKYSAYAREVRGQGYSAWQDVWGKDQNTYWNCFETQKGKNKTVSCGGTPGGSAYYYVLKDQDSFCDDMESQYNLDCDWVTQEVGNYSDPGSGGIPCERFGDCPDDGSIYYPNLEANFPVLDPSALITQSLANYSDFADWLDDSAFTAQIYMFPGMDADTVDGSSTLVFSLQASVQAMQQVADVGEQAAQAQKKEMILAFITAFLLMVPGIGEAADGVAALAQVARIAKLVDVAGNSALGIYGAVQDPKSAPMAVAGILFGGLALRDESAWGTAASEARSMSQDVIESMGDGVAAGMAKVKQTCKECSA